MIIDSEKILLNIWPKNSSSSLCLISYFSISNYYSYLNEPDYYLKSHKNSQVIIIN